MSARRPPELFDRVMAKAIDAGIWLLLALLVPPAGTLFGVLFWLCSDRIFGGQSPGKRFVGLLVLHKDQRRPCTLKESALRNLPFAVPALFLVIPVAGPFLAAIVGLPILAIESYFFASDPQQARLGDIFADTRVVKGRPRKKEKASAGEPPAA